MILSGLSGMTHWTQAPGDNRLLILGVALCVLIAAVRFGRRRRKKKPQRPDKSGKVNYADGMSGEEFERFCADRLKRNGYEDVTITGKSGDQGVDITAWKSGQKYAVQCKCYSVPVGNAAVQEAFAGKQFYHCDIAVVMTNSRFTSGARELAKATGVVLWDGDALAAMR